MQAKYTEYAWSKLSMRTSDILWPLVNKIEIKSSEALRLTAKFIQTNDRRSMRARGKMASLFYCFVKRNKKTASLLFNQSAESLREEQNFYSTNRQLRKGRANLAIKILSNKDSHKSLIIMHNNCLTIIATVPQFNKSETLLL